MGVAEARTARIGGRWEARLKSEGKAPSPLPWEPNKAAGSRAEPRGSEARLQSKDSERRPFLSSCEGRAGSQFHTGSRSWDCCRDQVAESS